jgi:hypothetical protein
MKNYVQKFNSRIYQAEERTSEVKDRLFEIIQSGAVRKNNEKE